MRDGEVPSPYPINQDSGRSRQRNGVLSSELPVGWDGVLRSGSARTGLLAISNRPREEIIFPYIQSRTVLTRGNYPLSIDERRQ
ncbi:MAG: hypothetical protein F6K18_18290 [Okeania sp. SIO2C2]|uniref:hypothetical protein n=1 Tax=Okeania sp. SIO2C2 TaxID=2607787 RepID=UPI0013B5B138|nr:hypothetical protein [Okeania sp. SIO2C2]NEP88625.1 hypothetical protein [Okeania sp. SIO2C2]